MSRLWTRPIAAQLFAMQAKLQVAASHLGIVCDAAQQFEGAAIPQHHAARAVIALGDGVFEVAVLEFAGKRPPAAPGASSGVYSRRRLAAYSSSGIGLLGNLPLPSYRPLKVDRRRTRSAGAGDNNFTQLVAQRLRTRLRSNSFWPNDGPGPP